MIYTLTCLERSEVGGKIYTVIHSLPIRVHLSFHANRRDLFWRTDTRMDAKETRPQMNEDSPLRTIFDYNSFKQTRFRLLEEFES